MANKKLVKKLDTVFSKYIRLRDCIKTTGTVHSFKCCTCGQIKPADQADAGHFIGRKYYSTRWNQINVHAQCRSCNRFNQGEQIKYLDFIILTYGKAQYDRLCMKRDSEIRKAVKFWDFELEAQIGLYNERIKGLKDGKD